MCVWEAPHPNLGESSVNHARDWLSTDGATLTTHWPRTCAGRDVELCDPIALLLKAAHCLPASQSVRIQGGHVGIRRSASGSSHGRLKAPDRLRKRLGAAAPGFEPPHLQPEHKSAGGATVSQRCRDAFMPSERTQFHPCCLADALILTHPSLAVSDQDCRTKNSRISREQQSQQVDGAFAKRQIRCIKDRMAHSVSLKS